MRDMISSKLSEIENEKNIKILYAVESGSRGWGFASQDSDYDVRFIYIHPLEWYLSVNEKKDYIEVPINNLLDINGWDIKKALALYKKSNPPLLEWLSSPTVYTEKYGLAQKLRDILPDYFSPVPTIYHYFHIAKNKYKEIMSTDSVKIKKYFYILRPIMACMWIEKNNTMPPMEFHKLLDDQPIERSLALEIDKLLSKKTAGLEVDLEPKSPVIIDFIDSKIEHFEKYLKDVRKDKGPGYDAINSLFRETLNEVWGSKV